MSAESDARRMADHLMEENLKGDIALDWPMWRVVLRNASAKMLRKAIMEGMGTQDEYNNVLRESQRRRSRKGK